MNAAEKWLKFAHDDLRSAEVLLKEGILNMVCFHSQQAVEKSLKAFLRQQRKTIPYIHVLEELCERCAAILPDFSKFSEDCIALDISINPRVIRKPRPDHCQKDYQTKSKPKTRCKKPKLYLNL